MIILYNTGVDWRDRKLIWNLKNKQVAYVTIADTLLCPLHVLLVG